MPKYNLGRKMEETEAQPAGESKKEIYYPSISVSTNDVEGLKLKMGEQIKLVGIVTGVEENEREGDKKESRYNIDIKQINKGMSEKEYLSKTEDEQDELDEKSIEEKEE